jgi:hypothetical protein
MESVTSYPLFVESAGYSVVIRQVIVVTVKGRVEACDLRQSREIGEKGTDRR